MKNGITTGAKTRATILRAAADIASVDGLEGLSIGRLATELGMSKSGLFAHFGSKQDLQLAIIEEARQRYVREVIAPALTADHGINRLYRLCCGSYATRARGNATFGHIESRGQDSHRGRGRQAVFASMTICAW